MRKLCANCNNYTTRAGRCKTLAKMLSIDPFDDKLVKAIYDTLAPGKDFSCVAWTPAVTQEEDTCITCDHSRFVTGQSEGWCSGLHPDAKFKVREDFYCKSYKRVPNDLHMREVLNCNTHRES